MELPHNFHKLSSQPHHLSSTTCERGNLFSTKIAGSKNVAKVWCFSRFFVIKILILYPISSKPGVSTLKPLFLNKRGRSYPRTDRYHPEWQWKGAALGPTIGNRGSLWLQTQPAKKDCQGPRLQHWKTTQLVSVCHARTGTRFYLFSLLTCSHFQLCSNTIDS